MPSSASPTCWATRPEIRVDAARRREYARLINKSGYHLLAVVNDILDMSRLETGDFEITSEPFRLGAVMASCRELLALKAQEAGVTLRCDAPAGLPDIVADKRAVKQILINLISNAIKFTDRGGTVTISADRDGATSCSSVEDTGIGIAPDDLARIGSPFFQARGTYARKHDGTGLGLSIVKGLVKLHGGEMEIRARPGEGTRIVVRLPLDCEHAADPPSRVSSGLPACAQIQDPPKTPACRDAIARPISNPWCKGVREMFAGERIACGVGSARGAWCGCRGCSASSCAIRVTACARWRRPAAIAAIVANGLVLPVRAASGADLRHRPLPVVSREATGAITQLPRPRPAAAAMQRPEPGARRSTRFRCRVRAAQMRRRHPHRSDRRPHQSGAATRARCSARSTISATGPSRSRGSFDDETADGIERFERDHNLAGHRPEYAAPAPRRWASRPAGRWIEAICLVIPGARVSARPGIHRFM